MRKIKLMCLTIALCGIFSVDLVSAEGDGGGFEGGDFDGGFDGGDFSGDYSSDYGSDFDSSGYSDFSDQNGFDPSDVFYQHDQFNQLEDSGFVDDASNESHFDQTGVTPQSNDFAAENNANHSTDSTGTVPNNDGFAHEFMKKELLDQSADTAQHAEQNSDFSQTRAEDHRNDPDTNPEAHSGTGTSDSIQSTAAAGSHGTAGDASAAMDSSTHYGTVTQTDASMQNVNIQNNTPIDQNTGHSHHAGHDNHHHDGGHHYYDNFGLGFGLGLGMGLGIGSFGYYSPFTPFGYYGGFGVPFSSFGFYGSRLGVGLYNNFAGFGPYRYFEPYYPLSGFLAASPVFSAPIRVLTYVQRQDVPKPPAASQQKNYWYYCRNPEGYYPYVKQCADQWIKVPPQSS